MTPAQIVAGLASEVFLWGKDRGNVVEASFDGYSRQPVAWTGGEGSPVEWIVAGPGGVPISGWGIEVDGQWVLADLGETYTPAGGDVIVVVPRLDVEVKAG